VIPPAVEPGFVSITIRKASNKTMALADLDGSGLFSEMKEHGVSNEVDQNLLALRAAGDWNGFFKLAVEARKNILISGATGSGKPPFPRRSSSSFPILSAC
jgi:type IV secretion system protein VirB11